MERITLRSKLGKFEIFSVLVALVVVIALAVLKITKGPVAGNDVILGGIFVMIIIAWMLERRRRMLRVDQSGISLIQSLVIPLNLPWDEIDSIGVASVSRLEEGLYQPGFTQHVGIRLAESSRLAASKACTDNRRLSDYDILLTAAYGMPVDQFAAFLNEQRSRFRKS